MTLQVKGSPQEDRRYGKARIVILVVVLAVSMLFISVLGRDLVNKMDGLSTAQSDNVQWTLSRLEVDRLRLQAELERAVTDPEADVADIRRRFDVFYSRVRVIQNGVAYAALRQGEVLARELQVLTDFLNAAVPLIDGPDETLRAALPELLDDVRTLEVIARDIALISIDSFAQESDLRREEVYETLRLAGLATVFLLAVLAVVVFFLLRDTRLSLSRANRLEETSTRLATTISTSLDAIVVANTQGRVLEYNQAAERIFGYTRAEAKGQSMSALFIPDHHIAAHDAGMKRYLATGEKRVLGKGRVQLEAKRKSGELFPVELSISSATTPEGEIFVSYLRDISSRVAAEAELVRARDDALAGERAKAKFMAIMSHEMRTPLNGIIGSLDLIRTTDLTETQRQYIEMMDFSGKRLLEHVNDVLDISKIEAEGGAEPKEVFDPEQTLRECVDSQTSLAQSAGNKLDLTMVTPVPLLLMGDPAKVRRIMLNLLGNANKFTRNGQVTTELEVIEAAGNTCTIEFRIADTGIGIAEENLDRVFDDFVTLADSYNRTEGGTGLGLGITKRLVESLGGEIGVESDLGVGSVFWVRLPFEQPPTAKMDQHHMTGTAEGAEAGSSCVKRISVLLVEDNQINQIVAQRMLEGDSHNVTLAKDGVDAVTLAGQKQFDLILMDISMPRMDGVEATQRIRSGDGPCKTVPIVALTAHTRAEDIEAFDVAGMSGYLAKPLTREALREALIVQGFRTVQSPRAIAAFGDDSDAAPTDIEAALNRKFLEQLEAFLDLLGEDAESTAPSFAEELHKLKGSAGVLGHSALLADLERLEHHDGHYTQEQRHKLRGAVSAHASQLSK